MSAHATLYTSGRSLYTPGGTKVILRGVDLPLLDDPAFPPTDYVPAIAKTKANAVRIQWYVNYGSDRRAYSLADLDTVLTRCAQAEMIPILMLSDLTDAPDTSQLNPILVAWWTSADVVAMLSRHAAYLIINIANEVGTFHWSTTPGESLARYATDYTQAIASIRASGMNCPLMIDAPDAGTAIDTFLSVGPQLIQADPQHNVLLSVHGYWAGFHGMPFIQECVNAGLPIVFGEIANKQDEIVDGKTVYGYYALDGTGVGVPAAYGFTYQLLLTALLQHEIGWLAWSWGPDWCDARMLSTNYTFESLSTFGDDFVNNPTYGLDTVSHRHKLV